MFAVCRHKARTYAVFHRQPLRLTFTMLAAITYQYQNSKIKNASSLILLLPILLLRVTLMTSIWNLPKISVGPYSMRNDAFFTMVGNEGDIVDF